MNRRWTRLPAHLAVWAWVALGVVAAPLWAAEETVSFAGVYRDDRITVELDHAVRSGVHTSYSGTIQMGEQKFPLKADAEEERLRGTFEDQGDKFEFTGSMVGRMLVLTTDGTTYRLKKLSINPLARPTTKPNPLAQPRTNAAPIAPTAPAVSVPPSSSPSIPPVSSGNVLRFRRYSINDDTNMIGGQAFSMLIPADWQVEGGLGWRMHRSLPAYLSLRAAGPGGTESMEIFPTLPFVWSDGGIPLFPEGSTYIGNVVAPPMNDPVAYIKKVILPRFRKNLVNPQVVATEEMPKVADAIAQTAQEPGLQKTFRAARVRLEYQENKRVMQEDIFCVLATTYAPTLQITFWGPDRNYSFKAEKGKLETRSRVFQTVINSIRPNFDWFIRYVQLVQSLMQNQLDTTRPVGDLTQFVVRVTGEVPEQRRHLFEQQQISQDKIDSVFGQYIRGLEEYRSPFDSRILQLPGGYPTVWANSLGEFVLSEDTTYNPNGGGAGDWQPAPKNH